MQLGATEMNYIRTETWKNSTLKAESLKILQEGWSQIITTLNALPNTMQQFQWT